MSTPEIPSPTVYRLAYRWPQALPKALPANQFAIAMGATSSGPDMIYLMMGHADPPFLSGSPEDVRDQANEMDVLPIDVLGRYVFTRSRLGELIALLESAAAAYDEATGGDHDADVFSQS